MEIINRDDLSDTEFEGPIECQMGTIIENPPNHILKFIADK